MKTYKIEIGVGIGKDSSGNDLSPTEVETAFRHIKHMACEVFNGYIIFNTQGGWVSPKGEIVEEPGATIMVFSTARDADSAEYQASAFASYVRGQLWQQCVALIITECNMRFV